MIVEHALLPILPGQESAFDASMLEALPIITSADKCFGAEVRRHVENGSVYLLLVRWESVEAHMAFRDTDLFGRWKALTHHFYERAPDVTHFHESIDT